MNNFSEWVSETDANYLKHKYTNLLKQSGFTVLDEMHHNFEPYGYTGIWLLSESHFAIHTFPEHNKTYIELSSCIDEPYKNFLKLNK